MTHIVLNLGMLAFWLLATALAAWFLIAPEHVAARLHCGGHRPAEPVPAAYRRLVRFYRLLGGLIVVTTTVLVVLLAWGALTKAVGG